MFTIIDLANYALFLAYVYLRVTYIRLLFDPANLIKVRVHGCMPWFWGGSRIPAFIGNQ